MITLTFTWAMFKWAGLGLFIMSIAGLLMGDLPDNSGSTPGNILRWISWPLLLLWMVVIIVRGIIV